MLVGHNTLRLMVMGLEDRAPRPDELEEMIALLEEGLAAGALGLSSGLFTPPGSFAEPSEMLAFGAVLKRHGAAYFTHIRDESNKVIDSVEEAVDFARTCGVHVEIVHLKCSGVDNWGKAAQILARIEAARAEGCDIDCDAYPYTAGANPLKNLLPPWVQVGGLERCWRVSPRPRRGREFAPRSIRAGSTIGAASRPGKRCRSPSRRACRSTPEDDRRTRRERGAATRSIWCATT